MKLLSKSLQSIVRGVLMDSPDSRDCDRLLCTKVWLKQMGNWWGVPTTGFLDMYVKGELTTADSITRCRRKLQEEDKTLRGDKWYKRKGRAEEVKQEIINFKYE
tara:strand:- start:744 stop:1055 length:312 start_codon:yes stop_codon:yes gene_type:complete